MNLIKKIAFGTATGVIALSSSVTPAFAAKAWNKNIKNSFANAYAYEAKNYTVNLVNQNNYITNSNSVSAQTGGNRQYNNDDGANIQTGVAHTEAYSSNELNRLIIKF